MAKLIFIDLFLESDCGKLYNLKPLVFTPSRPPGGRQFFENPNPNSDKPKKIYRRVAESAEFKKVFSARKASASLRFTVRAANNGGTPVRDGKNSCRSAKNKHLTSKFLRFFGDCAPKKWPLAGQLAS